MDDYSFNVTILSRMTETSALPRYKPGRRSATSLFAISQRLIAGLATLRNQLIETIAPMGYEDEAGFHYGAPPEQEDCSC